ncbi:MAG: MFS transporter, partial [Clostridia bacterium]|nr:MFS transporter [Clostridia bacterium]
MKLSLNARRRLTLSLCAFAYAIVYTGRQNLSIASPLLQADGILDSAAIGVMGSAFFFVYAIGRLCNGYIGDRVSRRWMLTLGMLAAGACNLALAFLPPLPA